MRETPPEEQSVSSSDTIDKSPTNTNLLPTDGSHMELPPADDSCSALARETGQISPSSD